MWQRRRRRRRRRWRAAIIERKPSGAEREALSLSNLLPEAAFDLLAARTRHTGRGNDNENESENESEGKLCVAQAVA